MIKSNFPLTLICLYFSYTLVVIIAAHMKFLLIVWE